MTQDKNRYVGCVEVVSPTQIVGWAVDTHKNASVELVIRLGTINLTELRADIVRPDIEEKFDREACGFQFRISDSVKQLIPINTPISIVFPDGSHCRAQGNVEPYVDGTYDGQDDMLADLASSRKKISPKSGDVIMPLGARTGWGSAALDGYAMVQSIFRELCDVELFLMYGTLLGCIRENDFLGHDDDFDIAFFSGASCASEAASDFVEIAEKIRSGGHNLRMFSQGNYHFYVTDHLIMDIFITWIEDGVLWGYNFGSAMKKTEVVPLKLTSFQGQNVLVPNNSEKVLAAVYGPNWQTPDPLFQWRIPDEAVVKLKNFSDYAKTIVIHNNIEIL
ncbi:MAG: hypothetical protein JKX99_10895 [Robiginitomaculum sp.]|nr:hypothetical protein [Robiginitomaculum sp.]